MKTYAQSLAALGDPTRLRIVDRLRAGPASVTRLAQGLPVSRPAVSQHLKILREAGLVNQRAEGTKRIYSLDPSALLRLRDFFEQFWDSALANFERAARERATVPEDPPHD